VNLFLLNHFQIYFRTCFRNNHFFRKISEFGKPNYSDIREIQKFGILQGLSLKQLSSTGMNIMNSFSNIIKVFQWKNLDFKISSVITSSVNYAKMYVCLHFSWRCSFIIYFYIRMYPKSILSHRAWQFGIRDCTIQFHHPRKAIEMHW